LYCLLLQKLFLLASNKKVERAVLRTALVMNMFRKPIGRASTDKHYNAFGYINC
jgi:hypothetical protein